MIQSKDDLKFYLFADRFMRYGKKERGCLKSLFNPDYVLDYLVSMRWTAYYNNCVSSRRYFSPLYLYHRRRFKKLGIKLGFSISYNSLGYGVVIPHHGTIVVNGNAYLGNYCVLHTCTCIAGGGKVGDGLYLSTGSIIVSPNLGEYVTIGANSLVHKSGEVSYSLLAGSPSIVLKENYPKWYERDGWSDKVDYIESSRNKFFKL